MRARVPSSRWQAIQPLLRIGDDLQRLVGDGLVADLPRLPVARGKTVDVVANSFSHGGRRWHLGIGAEAGQPLVEQPVGDLGAVADVARILHAGSGSSSVCL